MRVWSVCNQKGGVGKTTTAVSLAGLLAERGQEVLLVDLDPHGSMSSYFGINPDETEDTVYSLFEPGANTLSVMANTQSTKFAGISLLPASTGLATLDRLMYKQQGMGLVLQQALARVARRFDFAIIDSPPIIGVLMINALAACEQLLVPVQTEFLAMKGLERMERTLEMICISRKIEPDWLIVPTMYDQRTRASRQTLAHLQENYAKRIWAEVIPIDTRFRDAAKAGIPISIASPETRGTAAYRHLLEHLESAPQTALPTMATG
ncbi:MAG: ParA family protein [Pseudomonadota bacterium]